MKRLVPLLAAITGAMLCYQVNEALVALYDHHDFFGHVLASPVNLVSSAVFCATCSIMALRYLRLRVESCWARFGVLPEAKEFMSYIEVEPFAKAEAALGPWRRLRALCLLRSCFDAVRANWSTASAHQALKTQYELMGDALETQYYVCSFLEGAIVSIGFIGTLLGLGEAMGAIRHGTDAAIAELYVAFDTSLVATVLTTIAALLLRQLKKYDKILLLSAHDTVLHNFVFRIRDQEA